jgi:HPt (histidine-containing phosphotransfer) domain-containing protein
MEYKYINTEYLDSVSAGDKSVIIEIIDMFKEQAAEMHSEMKILLAEKNYHNLGLLAHKAKSSVAIMGMADLAVMLKTFELQAKEGKEPEKYESYVTRFRDDTAEAIKELDDLACTKLKQP